MQPNFCTLFKKTRLKVSCKRKGSLNLGINLPPRFGPELGMPSKKSEDDQKHMEETNSKNNVIQKHLSNTFPLNN
jgi:hypothetical protein